MTPDVDPPTEHHRSPLVTGGALFATHRAVVVSPTRIELRPAAGARVVVGVIAAVGAAAFGITLWGLARRDLAAIVTAGVFGLTAAVLGPLLHRRLDLRRCFDLQLGRAWTARGSGPPGADAVPLASVRGLQILAKQVSSGEGDYEAHELNLVLRDGRRVNLLSHANDAALREDAERIAALLGVPVWDERNRCVGPAPPNV